MITVYSTTWCGFCHAAKKYFDSLNIKYKDVDVEKDSDAAREMVTKSGQMGVPVIDINGTLIVGFNRPKIDEALRANDLI